MRTMTSTAPSMAPRGRKRKDVVAKTGEKRFVCQNDGCERSFTRAEHLQRHLLNHSTGDFTCSRCRAHFKRRDLLGRVPDLLLHEWEAALGRGFGTWGSARTSTFLFSFVFQEWMPRVSSYFPSIRNLPSLSSCVCCTIGNARCHGSLDLGKIAQTCAPGTTSLKLSFYVS